MLSTQPVNLRIPTDQVAYLRYLARFKSILEGEEVSYTQIIRDAINMVYPTPQGFDPSTMDMFMASGTMCNRRINISERK